MNDLFTVCPGDHGAVISERFCAVRHLGEISPTSDKLPIYQRLTPREKPNVPEQKKRRINIALAVSQQKFAAN